MFLGRRLQRFGEQHRIYNNGGASYVMNQASVGLLGNHLDDSRCQPHTKQSWEDVLVSISRASFKNREVDESRERGEAGRRSRFRC